MLQVESCNFIKIWWRYLDLKFTWWNLFLSNLLPCVKLEQIFVILLIYVECWFDWYMVCKFLWLFVLDDDECWRTRWRMLEFRSRSCFDPYCLAFACVSLFSSHEPITPCHVYKWNAAFHLVNAWITKLPFSDLNHFISFLLSIFISFHMLIFQNS